MWEAACRLHANTVPFYMRDLHCGLGICGLSRSPVFSYRLPAYSPIRKGTSESTQRKVKGGPLPSFLFLSKHDDYYFPLLFPKQCSITYTIVLATQC